MLPFPVRFDLFVQHKHAARVQHYRVALRQS